MSQRRDSGFTLVEVLVGTLLLVTAGVAFLFTTQQAITNSMYLRQKQVAMNAVQGQLEALAAMSFDTLLSNDYQLARTAGRGQCVGEDANCNRVLDPGEQDDGDGKLDPGPFPQGQIIVQIRGADLKDSVSPALLNIHVAACWGGFALPQPMGFWGRAIGEDRNCNGVLDITPVLEDVNNNGWIDSPVMVSIRVARRD